MFVAILMYYLHKSFLDGVKCITITADLKTYEVLAFPNILYTATIKNTALNISIPCVAETSVTMKSNGQRTVS